MFAHHLPRVSGPGLALTALFALAIAAPANAIRWAQPSRVTTPQATVRSFLMAAVVDQDGISACKYLTPNARVSFEGHDLSGPTCQVFFSGAGLQLGGLDVSSIRDLKQLKYTVAPDRVVTVSHGGQSMAFRLVKATPVEANSFEPPRSPWRIDSSVAALGTPTVSSNV
ncbi:MAG TPA: hypothetical protein VNS09_27785 [Solirubrobacter sp.]|nr:hypothetical protein [Solirubrobacter sp.]